MSNPSLELASNLRKLLVDGAFPREFAKLYSHYTRLKYRQSGLKSWSYQETQDRVNDAIKLLDVGFIEKNAHIDGWEKSIKKAGELLEWLSHNSINSTNFPLEFLAAAAYQVSFYPARALSLLSSEISVNQHSHILRAFLQADFSKLFELLEEYWSENIPLSDSDTSKDEETSTIFGFHIMLTKEIVRCFGIICSTMRWGDTARLDKAIDKLDLISKIALHGQDSLSWMLIKLCTEVARTYKLTSLTLYSEKLSQTVNTTGQEALNRYVRQAYQSKRSLVWPSQSQGIERLLDLQSFALCTPTGSGKTTVAELAILQDLFPKAEIDADLIYDSPLVLYLVPSRALATEVEARLATVLRKLDEEPIIVVTGLYGGTDWGPTDAWLTSDKRTILICTYEKGEALIRFLGPLFVRRLSLIIIDEAHQVQIDSSKQFSKEADNRALRLESLTARLFALVDPLMCRVIALSAVSAGGEQALARWASGMPDADATVTSYRSTRQVIGKLECLSHQAFRLHYDLLDGVAIQVEDDNKQSSSPYIPNPLPSYPSIKWKKTGPLVSLRPHLFWAALQFASNSNEDPERKSVLISVTQGISGYLEDFLYCLEQWNTTIPSYFEEPKDEIKQVIWQNCLQACEDYFSRESIEYKLLERGILVHYGSMPGILSRLLIQVIDKRIIHVVIATSTLTDGVNLPFETILVPNLKRGGRDLSAQEFLNLAGRSGRPGLVTEGRVFVVVEGENPKSTTSKVYRNLYSSIVKQKSTAQDIGSPLAKLLESIFTLWKSIAKSDNEEEFVMWLETTIPVEYVDKGNETEQLAIEYLDDLDTMLLSIISELEYIQNQEISDNDLEERLQLAWRKTFAYVFEQQNLDLQRLFVTRGKAIKNTVYPDADYRRHIYRTSLSPRAGTILLRMYPTIIDFLKTGFEYSTWNIDTRISYIQDLIILLSQVPGFALKEFNKNSDEWKQVLQWWLSHRKSSNQPSGKEIYNWYKYINSNFTYKVSWAVGNVISIAVDELHQGELRPTQLEEWPETGIPWVVFWIKEILLWGTTDPVIAYILSQGIAVTRTAAEAIAVLYYNEQSDEISPNDLLSASSIKQWGDEYQRKKRSSSYTSRPSSKIQVTLSRDFSTSAHTLWTVIPVVVDNEIYWLDPAGFELAKSFKPSDWQESNFRVYDFTLNSETRTVLAQTYI